MNSQQTKSENSLKEAKNLQEVIEQKLPHIFYQDQAILTQEWPNKSCKSCHGTGISGIIKGKTQAKLIVKPNDKCPCSSGKKFKKCCSELVTRMRMSGGSILICSCVGNAKGLENPHLEQLKNELKNRYSEEKQISNSLESIV